jgi:hypothetical protein
MQEIVSIAPLGREPGLIAYECPACGHVTSVLQEGSKGIQVTKGPLGRLRDPRSVMNQNQRSFPARRASVLVIAPD